VSFEVDEGFLLFVQGDRRPARLKRADEDGALVILGAEYVSFTPVTDESGQVTAIQILVNGEVEDRLVRE